MNTINRQLIEFKKDIMNFHIPRWEELPNIELYMDQVINFIEGSFCLFLNDSDEKIITASMVNNYVKLGLIPRPVKKKYNKVHLAYLIAITLLKHVFTIRQIRDGIIFQASLIGEKNAYNSFCQEQENALKSLMDQIDLESEKGRPNECMAQDDIIVKLGTLSFASKVITGKMIEFQKDLAPGGLDNNHNE